MSPQVTAIQSAIESRLIANDLSGLFTSDLAWHSANPPEHFSVEDALVEKLASLTGVTVWLVKNAEGSSTATIEREIAKRTDGTLGAFDTGTVALAGTRRSLYERIKNEQRLVDGHLYTDLEAKQALQAVFDCPLTETAKAQFAASLKSADASKLIDQMVALYREGQLVVEAGVREPGSLQIVASMGLSGGK